MRIRIRSFAIATWNVVAPALLACAVLRWLVPNPSAGARAGGVLGVIALVGNRYPLLFGVALFLAFSLVLRIPTPRKKPSRHAWIGVAAAAIGAAVVAFAIRSAKVGFFRVLSDSMLPTLEAGDGIAADLRAFASHPPERGDVIVFRNPGTGPEHVVKRVIGLPGDKIAMRGGLAIVNGVELPTCDAGTYVYPRADGTAAKGRLLVERAFGHTYLTLHAPVTRPFEGTFEVPPGEIFVLGDNRNNSSDSRSWNDGHGGGLPLSAIDGRVRSFVLGVHRDGTVDLSRAFEQLGLRLHLEGIDVRPLEQGIERCLREGFADETRTARGPS
jgi:signal peptidase I